MLPSETMIWQPEFTDKTLSRKPGAVQSPFGLSAEEANDFLDSFIMSAHIVGADNGFAPIFPDTCYHLTHHWPTAADIPVASDNPAHYA
ncbi:hypothetical protein QU775_27695, partial [Escherichia coli]|nr:hypothetical protein [Escherichia coli]